MIILYHMVLSEVADFWRQIELLKRRIIKIYVDSSEIETW